ncbi:MAG: transcriptional regulator [Thermodesulfobacteriales bacterium]|nr:MAG: transcriptional regulator [Thermodesulfobacteriales bacterium]
MEQIVHIIPLGHEIDRAIKPFKSLKANRVYLLTPLEYESNLIDNMYERQQFYTSKVNGALLAMDIEVIKKNVNIFDFLETLETISSIIKKEKQEKNHVYVNIAAAGRLTSVAAALAAMGNEVKHYYVYAEKYPETEQEKIEHGLSISSGKVEFLTNYSIQGPSEKELIVLKLLRDATDNRLSNDQILEKLTLEKVEGFAQDYRQILESDSRRRRQSSLLMKLNRGILEKLELNKYISRTRMGRNTIIQLTEQGLYMIALKKPKKIVW